MLGGASLNHHDGHVAVFQHTTGHNHLEGGALNLAVTRESYPLAVNQGDAGTSHRAREGQPSNLGGHGGGVNS